MDIVFKWIGGATWILSIDDIKIACDPVLCPKDYVQNYRYFSSKRLNDPVFNKSDFVDIDLWLLTHNHEDHLDDFGLKILDPKFRIIAHKSLRDKLTDRFKNVKYLSWDEESVISIKDVTIRIKAIPAIHAKRAIFSEKVGNGNGYLLEIVRQNSKYTVYVSGDALYNKKLDKYLKGKPLDLFIINAGCGMIGKSLLGKIIGRVTNNISDIKKMVLAYLPKTLIPVHWGTFSHYTELIDSNSFDKFPCVRVPDCGDVVKLQ